MPLTMRFISAFMEKKRIEWQLDKSNSTTIFIIASLLALILNLNIFVWKKWFGRAMTSIIALVISAFALDICTYLFFSLEVITIQNMVYDIMRFNINQCQYILYESIRFTGLVIGMFQIMFFTGFYYLTLRHLSSLRNIWSRRLSRRALIFLWAYYISFSYLYTCCTPVETDSNENAPICNCGLIFLGRVSMRTIFHSMFIIPLGANLLLIKKIYWVAENPAPIRWRFYRKGLKRARFQAAVRRRTRIVTFVTVLLIFMFTFQWLCKQYVTSY